MTPTSLSHSTPLNAFACAVPAVDSAVRLRLAPVPDRRAAVDGLWWPYSRDAAAELPGLVAAVDQRLGRTIVRVGVHREAWDNVPRRVPARGRQVGVDWSRRADPQLLTLTFAGAEPIVLVVVPPGAICGPARPGTVARAHTGSFGDACTAAAPHAGAPAEAGSSRRESPYRRVTGSARSLT